MFNVRFKSHHDASRDLKKYFEIKTDKEIYVKNVLNNEAKNDRVIYIHVPFCNKICSFCPFNKPNKLKRKDYDNYIINELKELLKYDYSKKELSAINFGGGTPTALSPIQMDNILTFLKENFIYKNDIEISVESSISELTDEMIDVLVKGKVNRLSIGVQTFNDKYRKILNRRGSGVKAIETIKKVIKKGIINTSIDLIYNILSETKEELIEDLKIIKDLDLAGISFYSLMIHENTPLEKIVSKKDLEIMNDINHEYELFDTIVSYLKEYGYHPLELTKLVKDKRDRYLYMEIRHNIGDCIAIGHGAGGNISNYVYRNTSLYPMIEDTSVGSMGKVLDDKYFVLDQMIYDMQKDKISFKKYDDKLNISLYEILKDVLKELESNNYIILNHDGMKLTRLGFFYGNNIIRLLIEEIIKKL